MQNLFNYDALAQWWELAMTGATKPYWALHRSAGGKAGQVIAFYHHDDVSAAWTALVETINNCIQQGVMEFAIVARRSGAQDSKSRMEYILRATGHGANSGPYYPGGQIAGMPAPAYAPSMDIGAITGEMEKRFALEKELEISRLQHKHQMERMEEMIEGIEKERESNFEKLLSVLNNPDNATGLIGIIQSIKALLTPGAGMPAAAPTIGNVARTGTHAPTTERRRPGRPRKVVIEEHPASNDPELPFGDDPHEGPDEVPEPETGFSPRPELEPDYDAALTAVHLLADAGWQNPGQLLIKVSNFAAQNPAMARQLLANLG